MQDAGTGLDVRLARGFARLGSVASRRPGAFTAWPLVLGTLLLALAVSRCLLAGPPVIKSDLIWLYTPKDGLAQEDKSIIDQIFPTNTSSNFEYGDLTEMGHQGIILATAKDQGSVLRTNVFRDIAVLDDRIRTMKVGPDKGGIGFDYDQVCARTTSGKCDSQPFHFIAKHILAIENGTYSLPYPFYFDILSRRLEFFGRILGGVQLSGNHVVSAKAIMLIYALDWTNQPERSAKWEEEFIREVREHRGTHAFMHVFSANTVAREFRKNMLSIVPYLVPAVLLMAASCMWASSLEPAERGKSWLALAGCVAALWSVVVSFAICILLNTPFILINVFIFFLMLGIGMDDTFMLITAWHQTDSRLGVGQRMEQCFSHVGVSITITSLTNLIAFLVGTITPFPAIHYFCIYISAAIVVCYIYQITFFAGVMVYFARMEEQSRHGFFVWRKVDANKKDFLPFPCCGIPSRVVGATGGRISIFIRDAIGGLLVKSYVKLLVILVFLIYLGAAIYGLTLITEDLDMKDLVRKDSYAYDMFGVLYRYFTKYQVRLQVVLNQTLDYSDPEVHQQVDSMLAKFESMPNMADPTVTWSWLRAFREFQKDPRSQNMLIGLNMTRKDDFLTGLRDVFFRFPLGRLFKKDVIFNENGTDIVASRFFPFAYDLESSTEKKNLFVNIQEIKQSSPFSVAVFYPHFPFYELWSILKLKTLQSIGFATIVLLIVIFLFMPNLTCVLCVAFTMISIEIGVMGFMSFFGIRLDSIVSISLILSIGLSVDYACHVSYAYVSCKDKDSSKKMLSALHYTAYPIIQSCLSTLLGVIVVFFLPSNTFLSVSVNVVLLVVFACFHSLFLLPVLLAVASDGFRTKDKLFEINYAKKILPGLFSLQDHPKSAAANLKTYDNDGFSNVEPSSVISVRL